MSDFELPDTRYALSGDVNVAFQVMGDGPIDIILVPGIVSHVEFLHEFPGYTGFLRRLATFARVVTFDKRGQGLSDGISGAPSLEQRVDDVRAIMDDIGSQRAVLLGVSEGSPMGAFFAAANPERVSKLILFGGYAKAFLDGRGGVATDKNLGHWCCDGSRGREPVDKSGRGQNARQIRAAFREPRHRQGAYVVEQADRRDVYIAERARADARASPANRCAGSY
jgi:pimeloyl-ACP methyl ester carboxylesterase